MQMLGSTVVHTGVSYGGCSDIFHTVFYVKVSFSDAALDHSYVPLVSISPCRVSRSPEEHHGARARARSRESGKQTSPNVNWKRVGDLSVLVSGFCGLCGPCGLCGLCCAGWFFRGFPVWLALPVPSCFFFSAFFTVTSRADLSIWQSLDCEGRRPKNRSSRYPLQQ